MHESSDFNALALSNNNNNNNNSRDWVAFVDDSTGDVYYHNSKTNETTWENPYKSITKNEKKKI